MEKILSYIDGENECDNEEVMKIIVLLFLQLTTNEEIPYLKRKIKDFMQENNPSERHKKNINNFKRTLSLNLLYKKFIDDQLSMEEVLTPSSVESSDDVSSTHVSYPLSSETI